MEEAKWVRHSSKSLAELTHVRMKISRDPVQTAVGADVLLYVGNYPFQLNKHLDGLKSLPLAWNTEVMSFLGNRLFCTPNFENDAARLCLSYDACPLSSEKLLM